jgi:hypothetical protein
MKVSVVAAMAAFVVVAPTTAAAGGGGGGGGGGTGPSSRRRVVSSWWTAALDGLRPTMAMDHHRKLSSLRSSGSSFVNNNPVELPSFLDIPTNNAVDYDHDPLHRSLEFGDYTDPSFSCPAMVTCNIVCVANVSDCPSDATCPGTTANNGIVASNSNHTYEVTMPIFP